MTETSICNDWSQHLPRAADGEALYLPCTGGVRCAEHEPDMWRIEPILDGNDATTKGFMTRDRVRTVLARNGLKPIAFHRISWSDGAYYARWSPIVPRRTNHMQGPADLWRQIKSNISRERIRPQLETEKELPPARIDEILDDYSDLERLAQSISVSLRNMDGAIEHATEFYHENLVNLMRSGSLDGNRWSSSTDSLFHAQVHSFFLHLGAARDYLGALIALRLGKSLAKVDSMARLVNELRTPDLATDALAALLHRKAYVGAKAGTSDKVEVTGWLKNVSDLRNEFIHRRPYGTRFVERSGYAVALDKSAGLYRYVRPVSLPDGNERDLLDAMVEIYAEACELFADGAAISGYNTRMLRLTDKDIIAFESDRQS